VFSLSAALKTGETLSTSSTSHTTRLQVAPHNKAQTHSGHLLGKQSLHNPDPYNLERESYLF
jgi:hypothetical protein